VAAGTGIFKGHGYLEH